MTCKYFKKYATFKFSWLLQLTKQENQNVYFVFNKERDKKNYNDWGKLNKIRLDKLMHKYRKYLYITSNL